MPAFSSGDSLPNVMFNRVDDSADVTIDEAPRMVTTRYGDRLVVAGVAGTGCTAQVAHEEALRAIVPGERVTVWVNTSNAMGGAVAAALKEAGLPAHTDSLAEGGRLRIKHTGTQPSGKGNPLKLYTARYNQPAPVAAGGTGDWD